MDEVLKGPEHARDNSEHLESALGVIAAGHSTEGPRALGCRPRRPTPGGPRREKRVSVEWTATGDHQRSTSPRTMSMDPRMATASATRRSLSSHGRICRFTNDGPRIFARNGFGLRPSLIM